MARRFHHQSNRSFGESPLQKATTFVQRGVGVILAAKGLIDTGRQIYGLDQAAAPYVLAGAAMLA